MAAKIAWPAYKFAFTFGLENIVGTRLILAIGQFMPHIFVANYVRSTGEGFIKDIMPDWITDAKSGLSDKLGDFVKMFDIMQIGSVQASINLSPFPTRLLSGTVIPTGIYFMMKDVNMISMFKFDLLLFNLDIFTLEPKLDVHMFVPKGKIMIGNFFVQLEGADPSISKAMGRMIAKRKADDARLLEKERVKNEEASAAMMDELKNTASLGRTTGTKALGAAKHLGMASPLVSLSSLNLSRFFVIESPITPPAKSAQGEPKTGPCPPTKRTYVVQKCG